MKLFIDWAIGCGLFTGCLAVEHVLSEDKWRDFIPGKVFSGILAGGFVLWIMHMAGKF